MNEIEIIQIWLSEYQHVYAVVYADGTKFAAQTSTQTSEHIGLYANGDTMLEAVLNWKKLHEANVEGEPLP